MASDRFRLPTSLDLSRALTAGDGELTRIRDDRSCITIGRTAAHLFDDELEPADEYPPTMQESSWLI